MLNPVLIIDTSRKKHKALLNIFDKLSQKDNLFYLLSDNTYLISQFQERKWQKNTLSLGRVINSRIKQIIFLCCYSYYLPKLFFKILNHKLNKKIKVIICLNFKEKILTGLIAKVLKIKLVWIEEENLDKNKIIKPLLWLYKLNSQKANIILFCQNHKQNLINIGLQDKQISLINPGIESSVYQNNIFNEIVSAEQKSYHKKYFTLGTIIDLNTNHNLETIFQAAKISLTVIPNLQLIVIGDGIERKTLQWLTKKMGIDNLVWFVGEQAQLKKWLLSFDIYIEGKKTIYLDSLINVLEAMSAQLPVIGPRNTGLEDIVIENKTGTLIEMDNEEMLARQIIKIQQNKKLKTQLGKNGNQNIKNNFLLEKTITLINTIINQ